MAISQVSAEIQRSLDGCEKEYINISIYLVVLVLCSGNILTKSFDLFQDRVGCGSPDKRTFGSIVLFDKVVDLGDKFFDTFKSTPSNSTWVMMLNQISIWFSHDADVGV